MMNHHIVRAAMLLTLAAAALTGPPNPTAADAPAIVPAAGAPPGYTLTGLDAHDGTIYQDAGTYYLVGTRYGCGFHWTQANTPFCGFGVWTSPALAGPWTFVRLLFAPGAVDSWNGHTWTWTCGSGGQGCFNPRMVRRPDGVWILWFNAPGDYSRSRANAYYALGCNGPAGPCGDTAGAPHGSTHKPSLSVCYDNGDFTIFTDSGTGTAYIACTMANQTLRVEQLDQWWTNGTGAGVTSLAGLTSVEAPGVFRAPDGYWLITYSDPNCGYCAGDGTGYAYASAPLASWTAPGNTGFAPDPRGRRDISATSCGGQPRTVFTVGGQPYEWIDLWQGTSDPSNQTTAGVRLEPLVLTPPYGHAQDGTVWAGGIAPYTCH